MTVIRTLEDARSSIQRTAETALTEGIDSRGKAVLALSGGSTPKLYLPAIFSMDVPWEQVTLALADERWTPPSNQDSNEKLIQDLRQGTPAKAASLLSLWDFGSNPEAAADRGREFANENDLSIDLAILGMGEDGHIASLFPGHESLEDKRDFWIPIETPPAPNAPLPRLSLSPKSLLGCQHVILAFSGQKKYDVWQRAWHGTQIADELPVSILKEHPRLTVICISE